MSNITYNKIIAKLEKLDEYFIYLFEIQNINKKTFVGDYHFYGLAERYLQLSIEVILDIGKLLIVSEHLRKPEDNQDIFTALSERKIISLKLLQELSGIVGFRNILVHDYDKIDREIVYHKLKENLDNFRNFKKEILKFLKGKK